MALEFGKENDGLWKGVWTEEKKLGGPLFTRPSLHRFSFKQHYSNIYIYTYFPRG